MSFLNVYAEKRGNQYAIGAIIGLILMVILLAVGLSVTSSILDATALTNTSPLYNASLAVINGTTSAYSMASVLLSITVVGAILGTLVAVLGVYMTRQE